MIEPMDDHMADITVRDYVCARCWGHLLKYHAPDRLTCVKCHKCGDDTPGYVTKAYADQRRAESAADAADVLHNLRALFPTESTGKTPEQITKEMGF